MCRQTNIEMGLYILFILFFNLYRIQLAHTFDFK